MAAAAALEGPDLELGFPNVILSCQIPASMSPGIRAAAPCAAEGRMQRSPESGSPHIVKELRKSSLTKN